MKKTAKIFGMVLCMLAIILSVYTPIEAADFDKAFVQIESYTIEKEAVVPGEEFTLELSLKNTSQFNNVGSCLITFESLDGMVEPVYGQSNQIFIDGIAATNSAKVSIKLKAALNIDTVSTPLIFNIKYADENTLENTIESKLFLPVSTTGTLRIENLSVPTVASLGTKSRISITYANSGVDELSNIVLHIVGNRLGDNLDIPLESLAGGDKKYAEAYIDYLAVGAQNLQISFTYDDEEGLTHETDIQSYDVVVSTDGGYSPTNITGQNGNNSKNFVIQIAVIAVVIIILVVLIIVYRKKKS